MTDSNFWNQVAAEREPRKTKGPYTQADLVLALAEMRAVLQLAGERIKQQSIGRKDDELLRKMRQVYREARPSAGSLKRKESHKMATRKNYGFPVVPHGSADETTECDGCIVVDPAEEPEKAKVYCSTCDVLYATVPWSEVGPVLVKLMGATMVADRCPHCGALNTFPGFDQMLAYTCEECGEPVQVEQPPAQ